MNDKPLMYIFTSSFPFGVQETFLETEFLILNQFFDVTFIPRSVIGGNRSGEKFKVCMSFSDCYQFWMNKRLIFFNWTFFKFIFFNLKYIKSIQSVKRLAAFTSEYVQTRSFIKKESSFFSRRSVVYSYWSFGVAYCLSSYFKMNDKITFISRAHGYDVYDSLYDPPFMPFRSVFLNNIDRLFVISSDGYNFISSKYGFHSKISISRLGTICNSNYVTFKENNFEFTFVSASNLYQLKNVPRLIRLLKEIACLNKLYVFNWHHFGDGPEYDIVLKETTTIPPNFRCFLHGRVPNSSIHNFYSSYYVDIFFNVSKSEGIPVSIMEALSYGIPVVAPDVGGVREIINNSVGILLEPSFSDTDFVEYVSAILSKKKGFVFDRSVIRSFWASNFSAVVNYTNFANEVMQIKPT